MRELIVTVKAGFCPEVTLSLTVFREEEMIKDILKVWENVTGLAYTVMPREHIADGTWHRVTVTHPLTNRRAVDFEWQA